MSEALYIKRRERRQLEGGFDALRREGIALAQQLSGERWTDYNLHDPGVTILEQLIYAITDIVYRADFPVADYLVDESGEIDYPRLALHRPEQVFTCRPTTVLDYRKAILNAVSELDDVWLIPVVPTTAQPERGLYRMVVKPLQGLDEAAQEALVAQVRDFYLSRRNLCEDLSDIRVVRGLDYQLCAEIEVGSERRPVDILAEIYFACARRIAGGITLYNFDRLGAAGQGLDQLFDGPFTDHGFFKDEEFGGDRAQVQLSTLYALINGLAGVDHVRELYLERDGQRFYDLIQSDSPESAFNLLIPTRDDQVRIQLTTNGRLLPISVAELRVKVDELNFQYHSVRSRPQSMTPIYRLPEGRRRPLKDYASIQGQFPLAYGIGVFGVPDSASPQEQARAKQLKGYLLLFEQLLANGLANLENIRALFSPDGAAQRSYAVQPLSGDQVPNMAGLYRDEAAAELEQIMAGCDDFRERKGRLLDYLLALYGESFSQHSLRHFNDYYSPDEVEQLILDNKIEFLQSVVALGRDRAAAGDYAAEAWAQRAGSGLQRRVSVLLGFKHHAPRPLSMGMLKQGIKLIRHEVYAPFKEGSPEFEFIDSATLAQAGFEAVPQLSSSDDVALKDLRSQLEAVIPVKRNLLSDALLRGGVKLDRYRLGSLTRGQDYQLTFRADDGRDWYLGRFAQREAGIDAANALRRFLICLNEQSEGLHVLEHLLLRPKAKYGHQGLGLSPEEDFYSLRISVIFPAWTRRCHNPQFRLLAEETVRLNTPAHIYPEFYWLDFHKMYEFEMAYEKWMALKREPHCPSQALDEAAAVLIRFLVDNRREPGAAQG